ncbi:MAG TPA: 2-oxo-4-hydroxy-4-carboxy-5-ureidoimidazoline decarboxylase [Burkholderiaceae bacterium]|nr:2-oxo-4-hydroxy-4-carboxy-5-ureidoimidazoline decarboxylase [Burkholderiaceae bacterium]
MISIKQLNQATPEQATLMLDGVYEHSPWIAANALSQRPFRSLAHLKYCLVQSLEAAGREAKLGLIRAHPELAGKAMQSNTLTAESTNEQNKAGLTQCTPDELAYIAKLNAAYLAKFGFPFILAVRGARGVGLSKQFILSAVERRLHNHPLFELDECIRQIHRIAEIRLNDKFGVTPTLGNDVWDWQEKLAQHSDVGYAEHGQLTVTYLTDAHRACAQRISHWMKECGCDSVEIDAVGNVVGVYEGSYKNDSTLGNNNADYSQKISKLLTGSHYDTVRNGGKYDGRLGIFVPMACVRELKKQNKRLPFGIEIVAFAEEEGQRYKATFLGSGALIGDFKAEWLDQTDADGITMRQAMQHAGLCVDDIAKIKRDATDYLGFVEVHIEQGPVLNELNIPLGIVTSINGSVRYNCEVIGTACHAGTTPMNRRADAAAAVAELILYAEQRAMQDGDSVATVGILNVPNGSTNVVPGRCQFTLDMRAPNNAQRDAMVNDILAKLKSISERRNVRYTAEQTMCAAAAPSSPEWQQRWEKAVDSLGVPLYRMPSGAGHDAMKLHEIMPQAMLFVRGENSGISHNPLESSTNDDMQLAVEAFSALLENLATEF